MSAIVLDASAILAFVLRERRAESLSTEMLRAAVASSVNLAEVQTKMVRDGYDPESAWEDALSFVSAVVPFTSEQAKLAGALATQTRKLGLSLGDRSCLALGIALSAPVYTTDDAWQHLNLPIPIQILR